MLVAHENENLFKTVNFFIKKSAEENIEDFSPLKLIKLCYIAYGVYLAVTNKSLFKQRIEAWKYGPVIRDVYDEFKRYGNQKIKAEYWVPVFTENVFLPNPENSDATDKTLAAILEDVWKHFHSWTPIQLSSWTHQSDSAWSKTYYNGLTIISDELIKQEFSKYVKPQS